MQRLLQLVVGVGDGFIDGLEGRDDLSSSSVLGEDLGVGSLSFATCWRQ